jgi:hypothetical protein
LKIKGHRIGCLKDIASGLIGDDLNTKIQEGIGNIFGAHANALVEKMSERRAETDKTTDKITIIQRLQQEIDKLNSLSIAVCHYSFEIMRSLQVVIQINNLIIFQNFPMQTIKQYRTHYRLKLMLEKNLPHKDFEKQGR